jgi:hypothetical protein
MVFCILTNDQLHAYRASFHLWRYIFVDILLVYSLFIYSVDALAPLLLMSFGNFVVDILFTL